MSVSLQAQAPAKILLFGEWAVLDGATAIVQSLGVYFKSLLKSGNHQGLLLIHDKKEYLYDFKNQKIPNFWTLTLQILKNFSQEKFEQNYNGLILETQCEWKINEGLGTSSALFLTLFLIHQRIANNKVYSDHSELWKDIWPEYKKIFKGSGVDLASQVFGGSLAYKNSESRKIQLDKPHNLKILHTGKKLNTQSALQNKKIDPEWSQDINKSVEKFLIDRNWFNCIDEHRRLLSQASIMENSFVDFYNQSRKNGVIQSLKSVGAGGGDALIALIHDNKEQELDELLFKQSWWLSDYPWLENSTWSLK